MLLQETPAGSEHDDDDNAVQIVTDDTAAADTEAELAAEAHKAQMLSQLVKAANQANYTSIMLVRTLCQAVGRNYLELCARTACVRV